MAGNSALSAAVKAKKDEFYTQLTDIEKEMRYYRKHFKDKTVLCNCDDPFESNFFKYFVLNFNRLGLKKLIATCYFSSPIIGQQLQYGRYIKQAYISGHEGQILSDIASEKLYLRHLPDSFQSGKHIDAARFVMITAAFEWEFDRLFPDGICKSKERVEAELIVSQKLNELIDTSSGKTKKIYKSLLKCIERRPSLANKIEKIGSDMGALLEPFGQQLYGFNKEELNYTDMGKRLGDQRNYFAHGDLDKDFIGLSLLDLIFLQRIIYAIQLKISGLEDKQIQRAINDLFQCRFAI